MEAAEKFKSCEFRSDLEEIGEFSCCMDSRRMGYTCFRRHIEDLKEQHCAFCTKYKQKNTYGSENQGTDGGEEKKRHIF